MKHAYLIMAHNEFNILEKIIKLIDDERNDIFVHIDENSYDFNIEYFIGDINEEYLFNLW